MNKKEYSIEDIIEDIKTALKKRGTNGIRQLGRLFKVLDNNGNRQLEYEEIKYGLYEQGISLNEPEM